MAEGPERACRNCGHELRAEDRYCPNCGRPVYEAAQVRTSQANVEVPPLSGAGPSQPAQQEQRRGMFQSAFGVGAGGCLGIIAGIIAVIVIVSLFIASCTVILSSL
jgi:predicted RNA-binding Zn-ribbon protein involved in translation (DUF1610 family)